jgi:hypothetical protein
MSQIKYLAKNYIDQELAPSKRLFIVAIDVDTMKIKKVFMKPRGVGWASVGNSVKDPAIAELKLLTERQLIKTILLGRWTKGWSF